MIDSASDSTSEPGHRAVSDYYYIQRQIHPSHKTSVSRSLQQSVTRLQFVKFRNFFYIYINLLKYNIISVSHFNLLLSSTISPTDLNRRSGLNNPHWSRTLVSESALVLVCVRRERRVNLMQVSDRQRRRQKSWAAVFQTKRSVSM